MFRGFPPALLCLTIASASAADTSLPPVNSQQWKVYADCAAAYQANWQDRLTDPSRSHDMSAMIHDQSEDYKKAAVKFYQGEMKTSPDDADGNVAKYVETKVGGFLVMDAAGTLEAYLDQCPQPEVEEPN